MASTYPELTRFSPALADGYATSLRPEIILDWSTDVDTVQFSDVARLAQNVLLILDETSQAVELEYVSYDVSYKRVTLKPKADLLRGKTYRVVVKDKIKDTYGRKSLYPYQWVFTTAGTSIGKVSLLSPGNATVQPAFPSLSWQAPATGSLNYLVQIDENFNFTSPIWEQVTIATGITPAGLFTANTTYYWRVLAYTASASGTWSDVASFFYGSAFDAHRGTQAVLADADPFGVNSKKLGFRNGMSHQKAHPAISVAFTSPPASGTYQSYVSVVKMSVLPRNDDVDTYFEEALPGSWAISGSTITFTPSGAIEANTRYELRIKQGMLDVYGRELGEDYTFYWVGQYKPLYCSPREIRSRFRSAEQIPEDLMYWYIFRASLLAKAKYAAYFYQTHLSSYDSLTEGQVRDSADLNSHALMLWVEATATYNMLKSILFEELRNVDRTRIMQRFQDSLGPGFIEAMRLAMEVAKDDIRSAEEHLIPSERPVSVGRYELFSPDYWCYDLMLWNDAAPRGRPLDALGSC